MFTKNWWRGFYIGHIWVTTGISIINLLLLIMVMLGSTDYHTAFLCTAGATSVLIISSVVMSRVVERENID